MAGSDNVRNMKAKNRPAVILILICFSLVLGSCSETPDSGTATETFAACLERNGVDVEDLEVSLNADGSIAGIAATILSEGDVPYEPTVRLACTEEVELGS